MTESSTPTLSNEQLGEVLRLIKGSDSVELKLTVPDADHASAVAALEMDVLDAQIRQVVFFDTPDLTLNQHGVVVRGRRVQGRDGDTVVKLRPIDPADVPAKVRKDPGFGIEVDAMPGGFVCSGSMKATLDDYRVKETFAGSRPLSKLLTREQRRFFADHAPEGVALDDLARLGPINVLKLKFTPGEYGRKPGGRTVVLPRRDAACSSCRRSAPRAKPSRWPPRRSRSWPVGASTSVACRRRRRAWRWTTSPASSRPPHS